jgi:hypothetical protein
VRICIKREIIGELSGKRGTIPTNHFKGPVEIRGSMGTSKEEVVAEEVLTGMLIRVSSLEGDAYWSCWKCWGRYKRGQDDREGEMEQRDFDLRAKFRRVQEIPRGGGHCFN